MTAASSWALSLAYWLHMLATVIWIGALATLALLVLPAARRTLEGPAYAGFLEVLQKRLDPLAWLSLVILLATGMFQMSASPFYEGFLSIEGRWGTAIFIKHLVFICMTGVSAYLTWGLLPQLRRLALARARGQDTTRQADSLQRREARLIWLNLALGVLVLALTAVARSA